jgi:CDP-6-deoxy-D-xylo-4-hexulose-3-dehydrase
MNALTSPHTAANTKRSSDQIRSEIMRLVDEYCVMAHRGKTFVAGQSDVPVSGRVFDSSDVRSLIDSALEFWLTTGRFNAAFQANLAKRIGVRYALTVNSGSSANLVAFSALTSPLLRDRAIAPGSEVITASTGFPTTVNPMMLYGMVPVFIDVDIPTYNILPETVEAAITSKTRAIMAAHTLGNPFDAMQIAAIAKRHKLFLIEDCCDALGATFHGRHVGTFGDIGTLSFYPAHHITMGEGGAAFTQNPVLRRAMETFRDWGRDCYCDPGKENTCQRRFDWQLGELPYGYDHKYIYSHMGFNLKITDMQAAVGLAQLDHLERFIQARRNNFRRLKDELQHLEEFFVFPDPTAGSEPSWFGFVLTIRETAPFTRDEIVRHLNEKRIGTRLLFGGNLVRQPYMQGRCYRVHGSLANSDRIMSQTFWIGVYPGLTDSHLDYVCETIHSYCTARSIEKTRSGQSGYRERA